MLYCYIYIYIYYPPPGLPRRCDLGTGYCLLDGYLLEATSEGLGSEGMPLRGSKGPPQNRQRCRHAYSWPPPRGLLDASNRLKTPLGSIPLQCWGACASPDPPCFEARRPKRLPKRPKTRQDGFLSQHGPMLAPTWSHVGTKIAFRRYLMLKQPES